MNKYLDFSTFSNNKNRNLNNSNLSYCNNTNLNINENSISNNTINTENYFIENSKDSLDVSENEINNYTYPNTILKKFIQDKNLNEENFANEEKQKLRFGRMGTIKNELQGIKISGDFYDYFKKNFKQVRSFCKHYKKERHLDNLFEIQNIQMDIEEIWIAKFRQDGKYFATGGKSGTLKIWETLNLDNSLEEYTKSGINGFFKFFKDYPFRIYKEHFSDIIDICWSNKVKNLYYLLLR